MLCLTVEWRNDEWAGDTPSYRMEVKVMSAQEEAELLRVAIQACTDRLVKRIEGQHA